jgi:hypothetical protein
VVRSLWIAQLPLFWDERELNASEWRPYVQLVYGPLHPSDFPMDVRCFTFFWRLHVPDTVKPLFAAHVRSRAGQALLDGEVEEGRFYWEIYLLQHAEVARLPWWRDSPTAPGAYELRPPSASAKTHPSAIVGPVSPGERFEGFHAFSDCALRTRHVRTPVHLPMGWWLRWAPGSGIFVATGARGVVVSGAGLEWGRNRVACRLLSNASTPPDCTHTDAMVPRARAAGWTSLQSCCGPRLGARRRAFFEMVLFDSDDCRVAPNASCHVNRGACPAPGVLSRGRGFARPCACDGSLGHVNCDGGCRAPTDCAQNPLAYGYGATLPPHCSSTLARAQNASSA